MDYEKLAAFVSKVGIVPAMMGWMAYEFHQFIKELIVNQQQMIYLMQRLIDLHK